MSTPAAHQWKFARTGGLDQVVLSSADDLLHLRDLDQKLWTALSCPVSGLELDEATLKLIDTDNDARVRVPEILAAIAWLAPRLRDLSVILQPSAVCDPAELNTATPEGAAIAAAADRLQKLLPPGALLDIPAIATARAAFAASPLNGDGVITPETAADPRLQRLLADIIATSAPVPDLSGKPGVNQPALDAFLDAVTARAAWLASATPDKLPLGPATRPALDALLAVRAKINDFFARRRLADYDPRALDALNRDAAAYLPLLAREITPGDDALRPLPLAQITPGNTTLPLAAGLNPAWTAPVAAFLDATVTPLLGPGKTALSEDEWLRLNTTLAPFETWLASQPAPHLATLGDDRLREIASTAANDRQTLAALIAADAALEPERRSFEDLERLLRYRRDLRLLLANFVNFSDFYDPARTAVFQTGTLYFDTRACDLCIRVDDPAAHAPLAARSNTCVAYCDLKRQGLSMKIAAVFTQGDSDYLMPGRNGVFYDRLGRDWDATITRLIDNPISLRAAFWSPYKKFVRTLENLAAKRAAAADDNASASLNASAASAAAGQPAAPKKMDVGTVAALGVALGALTTALAAIATGIMRLHAWQLALVPAAVILLISLPSVFLAWLKLRQRTLGPLLDATGWAVNGRIKINIPLGASLTHRARLPEGSLRAAAADPFRPRHRLLKTTVLLALLASLAASALLWRHHLRDNPPPPPQQQQPAAGQPAAGQPAVSSPTP
jgi:hypothetical protein